MQSREPTYISVYKTYKKRIKEYPPRHSATTNNKALQKGNDDKQHNILLVFSPYHISSGPGTLLPPPTHSSISKALQQ